MDPLDWRWLRYAAVFVVAQCAGWWALAGMRETFDLALAERDRFRRAVKGRDRQIAELVALTGVVIDGTAPADVEDQAADVGDHVADVGDQDGTVQPVAVLGADGRDSGETRWERVQHP